MHRREVGFGTGFCIRNKLLFNGISPHKFKKKRDIGRIVGATSTICILAFFILCIMYKKAKPKINIFAVTKTLVEMHYVRYRNCEFTCIYRQGS